MPVIVGGQLLLPAGEEGVRLAPGALQVDGDRIVGVWPEGGAPRPDLGGDGYLITPGFADTHLHLPQFDSIGRCGLTLLDWLNAAVFPAEARWADASYAAEMTGRVARQLQGHGTTAIGAYATVHAEATAAAMRVLGDAGFAGVVGQVLMDRGAPADLIRPADQLIAQARSQSRVKRIGPAVTPRFAISCTPALLEGAGRLAAQTGWTVQTHLAETAAECERVRELFEGAAYTEIYRRSGLLTPRSLLAHGICLDDADRVAIATARSTIAHCPTANSFLRSGDMNLQRHRSAGVRISLGSDIAGGYERSMVRVARAALETAGRVRPTGACTASGWAWWQITEGGARALGLADTGRLEAGCAADVLVIKPDVMWQAAHDPLDMLLYAWDDRWLQTTIAAGRVVYAAA